MSSFTEETKAALRARIRSYLDLPDDLGPPDPAGNPVVKPSRAAVSDALRFLDALPPTTRPPLVSRADDGEVGFFWRTDGVFIDVGFFGDGKIGYYAEVPSVGIDHDGDEHFDPRSLPLPLLSAIEAA